MLMLRQHLLCAPGFRISCSTWASVASGGSNRACFSLQPVARKMVCSGARAVQTASATFATSSAPGGGPARAELGRLGRAAQRLAASGSGMAFLGRWALWLRASRRTRLCIRAFRTAFLCGIIWSLGEGYGMMKYAADPEGEAHSNLVATIRQTVGDGSDRSWVADTSEGIVISKDHAMHKRASKITQRVLRAAQEVVKMKAAAWETKHGKWTEQDTATEGTDRENAEEYLMYLRAHRNLKQRWTLVLLNDQHINAFVTDLCPRTIFVHAQLMASSWTLDGHVHVDGMTDDELAFVRPPT
eukprot:COSAG02_NODE_3314_length_6953_cov_4.605924_12_plen_300_part_00